MPVDLQSRPTPVAEAASPAATTVSVVVPVCERYDDLVALYHAHSAVLRRLGQRAEWLVVLDGGFAAAARPLEPLIAAGEPLRLIFLPRWVGEATALMVGFAHARSDRLLVLPPYAQVVPEGLAAVLEGLEAGADVVVARRFPRCDAWVNRLQTRLFHRLVRWLTGVQLRDMGCGLKGLRRRVAQELVLYGDLHRFLPVLAYQRGFRVQEVDVPQHPANGRPRIYSPGVYLRRLLDLLTLVFLCRFTRKPLRFFGLLGMGLFATGFFLSLVLALQRLFFAMPLAERPLLILGVLLMVLGVQTGSIGFLGEIIVFTHSDKVSDYHIDRILE
ncbi:MAG: dolichol-phosphate mannosyltransferase [Candidatus Tectimicrobiota bacterium]|nr:MAG: dolichol-phosphate mannosyltransferase [Candidatus Tectomicrobia bacterium]